MRRSEGRAGVRLAEIADKNMNMALTTCLRLDIPVSFLINPDIYRTETNTILLILESQDRISTLYNEGYGRILCPSINIRLENLNH